MDDLDLHLALEALRTNPATHAYHERISRGMQAIEQGTLTPFERDALHRLLARFPVSMPPPADPVGALIAAFQDKLPTYDPAAVATAIQHALAQRPATLNGAPVTIRMDGDTHAHQANLAIGNQVGGNLVQVTVTIPIPDARFDALLATTLRTHEQEKTLDRIRHAAQQIESDRLLNLRLQGFVGRITELAAIRTQIAAMRPTGGYVLIKAAAGEGKSSSIAKLIQEAGITQTPHHFIALTTGREYQLGLLRAVVAQLILKYGLTVSYFPEESYPAMKGEFARILDELSKQGIHETIYLDGLDQLQSEIDGSRDLSFLPPQPPPGIVIVLGSRPDETLKPLEILHRVDYALPPLSEADALALWRSVQPGVASGLLHDLYRSLKGNALFVHLAADTMQGASVIDATSLIKQIEQNPSNLFGITLERIKGRSRTQWNMVWKPMLALLLVAQEPLRLDVLGDLLGHDHDTMQDAVWVLGGLVSQGVDQRVALHHLLFRDYLAVSAFNQREVKRWHQRLADWCAQDVDAIWIDDRDPIEHARRMYARHHYVTHLFLAENWTTLWLVLDTGDYGEHKTRFDPSTRLYALDLDRGRESAIKAGQSTEEHIHNLPRLWKYTLLRTSLTSHVDQWPDDLFELLAMLGRTHEALERIELCSDPERQIKLWSKLIGWCTVYQRRIILPRIEHTLPQLLPSMNDYALTTIAEVIAINGNLIFACTIATSIDDREKRTATLERIANIATDNGHFDFAFATVCSIHKDIDRIKAFLSIAKITFLSNNLDFSTRMLQQAIMVANSVDEEDVRTETLAIIANAASIIGYCGFATSVFLQAIKIAQNINHKVKRANILILIAKNAATSNNSDITKTILHQALMDIQSTDERINCSDSLGDIAEVAATNKNFDFALRVAQSIHNNAKRSYILVSIAEIAASNKNFDFALRIAQSLNDSELYIDTLMIIAKIAISDGKYSFANSLINQVLSIANTITDGNQIYALISIAKTSAIANNLILTTNLIDQVVRIDYSGYGRTDINIYDTLLSIAKITAENGNLEYALTIANSIHNHTNYINALLSIAKIAASIEKCDFANKILQKIIFTIQSTYIKDKYFRSILLIAEISTVIRNTNFTNQILQKTFTMAQSIHKGNKRTNNLLNIAEIAAVNENIEFALTIAHSINDDGGRAYALMAIAKVVATNGSLDRALDIANSINEGSKRIDTILSIARIAVANGNLQFALTTAYAIDNTWSRMYILAAIAEVVAANGSLNIALSIVNSIDNSWKRNHSLLAVVKTAAINGNLGSIHPQQVWSITCKDKQDNIPIALYEAISNGNLESAIIHATSLKEAWMRAYILANIAEIAINKNKLDMALIIAHSADHHEIRSIILAVIARATAIMDNLNFALSIVYSITNQQEHTSILANIAKIAAASGKLDFALAITYSITDQQEHASILANIAKIAAASGKLDFALTVVYSIDNILHRASIFRILFQNNQHNYQKTIDHIQLELYRSKQYDDPWRFLPLVTPLLNNYPWIGAAILEGEGWGNAQLKRLG